MRLGLAAAAAAGAAALALVVGTAAGWWNGAPPAARSAPPLAVAATLTPQQVLFGDAVAAEVDVLAPANAQGIRVDPSFAPFAALGRPSVERTRIGRLQRLRFRWRLTCLDETCLPGAKPRSVQLPPFRVGGRTVRWPAALVVSRLAAADVAAAAPRFRGGSTLPPAAYRVGPTGLATALTVLAGVLAAGGLLLLALEARRLVARRRAGMLAGLAPLQLALLYTREAASRPDPADRRKALGLLAETLPDARVERLAWGPEPPSPERTLAAAADAEERT